MKLLKENLFPISAICIMLFLSFKKDWPLWSQILIVVVAIVAGIVIIKDSKKSK